MGAKCSTVSADDRPVAAHSDHVVDDSVLYVGPLKAEGEGSLAFEKRKNEKIMILNVQPEYIDIKGVLNEIGGAEIIADLDGQFASPSIKKKKFVAKAGFVVWKAAKKKCIGSNLEAAKFQQYRGPKTRALRWRHEFGPLSSENTTMKSEKGRIKYASAPHQHPYQRMVPVRKPRQRSLFGPLDYLSHRKREPIATYSVRVNIY